MDEEIKRPVDSEAMHAGTKPNMLATLTKNSFAGLFRIGSSWLVVLFLPPLLVRVMDKPTYAVWLLLLQLAAYVTFFDGGIQIAIARYVARSGGLQARDYLAGILSSAGAVLIGSSLVTVLIIAVCSWNLTSLFRSIPASIAPGARVALFVIGTSLALNLPFSVLAGYFLGRQRFEIAALSASFGKFVGALGSGWAAYHHKGLLAMAIWIAVGNGTQSVIYWMFWRKEGEQGILHHSWAGRAMAREFILFCSAMLVTQFSSLLITGLDMPVVVAFAFRSAAYYGVASILSNFLVVPYSAIVSSLLPVAAEISVSSNPRRLGEALLKTTRFATAVLCLFTLPILLLMPDILRIWVGPDYAAKSLALAEILLIAQFVRLTMFPYAMIGFAAGQQRRMLVSPISEGMANLAFSLILVRIMGAGGVAIGTLIGSVLGVWLHLTLSLRGTDSIQVDRSKLIGNSILKPTALMLPLLMFGLLISAHLPQAVRLLFVTSILLALFALFWRFIFDLHERNQMIGALVHSAKFFGSLVPGLGAGESGQAPK